LSYHQLAECWLWLDDDLIFEHVQVFSSEGQPFGVVDCKCPACFIITAAFYSIDLKYVITFIKKGVEIIILVVIRILEIIGLNLPIKENNPTKTKVLWDVELVITTISSNWEHNSIIESDVLFRRAFTTQDLVADLCHVRCITYAVALLRIVKGISKG